MRLIDAEAYKSYIRKTYCQHCDGCFDEWRHDDCWQWYAIRTLEEMPTIEAKPVVHAHWEEIANGFMVCSHCKESVEENRKYSYCPICGAQMDELVSNTDELKCSEKPNSSVKIPVISMEDVPKIMEEKE